MKFKKLTLSIFFVVLLCIFSPSRHVQASPSVSDFVTNLYLNVQGRSPDTVGLNYWTNMLTSRKISGADIVKEFLLSPEFNQKGSLSNEEYVNTLYKAINNRLPDPDGKLYWTGLLNNYNSRLNVLSQIIASPEFANTCKNYGILQGQIVLTNPIDIYPNINKGEANSKDLEDLIFNYIHIYKDLINNRDLDITYINDVLIKNSAFETNIKNEIKDYRTKYSKIEDLEYKIKSFESINNTNEYSILVEEQVNYLLPGGKSQKLTNNYKYTIILDKQDPGIMNHELISSK